jgi:dethiobiotin synthetase
MGSASGAGKTTLCEGLLSQLLQAGYRPEQLAYIKPMTQCTDKQVVTMYCERENIAHQSMGLVFEKGFTKDFIDGLTKTSSNLLEDILAAILKISEDKNIVIVDGIGNPATGSVIGVSNVDIALALAAPVLFVGKAGIGSAIDDTVLAVSFMQQQGIQNIALIYNKIQPSELVIVKHFLSKRLAELLPNVPALDFIANNTQLDSQSKHQSAKIICQWFCAQSFCK